MNYFRSYLGTPQEGQGAPSGAETIERLCDRVQSSTLLDDRRDAVRALKSLSKKFRLEVGTQGLDILMTVINTDRNDAEIVGYALETLCNVMSQGFPDGDSEPLRENEHLPDDLGVQFTEMFIKTVENVHSLLGLLEDYDFHVRWPTVKLITVLLSNKGKEMQEIILTSPAGVSKMMDLLSDSREIIRNDGLLLLTQLTRSNSNIQKIVAFENAFERLIDIIMDEGCSEGGIVVEDCLLLLLNLLKNNISNQNFFKEGSFVQRVTPFFDLQQEEDSEGWSAQKVTNIHLMLQVVRTLVSPSNPQQQTTSCQKLMNICGLLEKLCIILMASGVPADVLTETINTVAEAIRGNQLNQEYFASVLAPSNPPRPAIVILLMSMVNEKQPLILRCSVLYCFQSFLYKNELGQSQIVQTLLPTSTEANTISAGQLLCGGLFSPDPLSCWFAATALLHAVVNNSNQKEQLLRVQLATSLGNPPVSLLQQCTNILSQGVKIQTRVGLLMLLSHWLAECPIAVTHFLHNSANIPMLTSHVSASEGDEMELVVQGLCAFVLGICVLYNENQVEHCSRNDLRQIIEKRIGLEQFTDKLSQVSKHECYSKAAKKPQLNIKMASEVILDYEYARLFKRSENEILKILSPARDIEEEEEKKKAARLDQHESIVEQYKELIREQDSQLNVLRKELSELKDKHSGNEKSSEEYIDQIQQLKDQNALLKAQRGGSGVPADANTDAAKLQTDIAEKDQIIQAKDAEIAKLKASSSGAGGGKDENPTENKTQIQGVNGDPSHLTSLNAQLEDMKKLMTEKDEEISVLKGKVSEKPDSDNNVAVVEVESKLKALNLEKDSNQKEIEQLKKKNDSLQKELAELRTSWKELEQEKLNIEVEKDDLLNEQDEAKKEQDDLFVLMADQDTKLKEYRTKLKELGHVIDDDDDNDDDDLDDDEDYDEKDD